MNNKEDSEECVNDTYLRAWNTILPKQPARLRTFLGKITRNLSIEKRKMFVRRYWYFSSVKEIAKDFGISESKVTVTLFRTRQMLKEVMEKEGVIL